jgi:hypothetical protein
MAYSRYTKIPIFLNATEGYRDALFAQRGVTQIQQYASRPINYPSLFGASALAGDPQVWGATDKLYNIAYEQYGTPQYWWIIAWFNQKASEADFKVGDIYYVPRPLERVLEYF